jgi:hypothetical protein
MATRKRQLPPRLKLQVRRRPPFADGHGVVFFEAQQLITAFIYQHAHEKSKGRPIFSGSL